MSLAPNPSKASWSWQMTPHRPWYGCSPLLLTYSPAQSLLSPLLPCSLISFCQTFVHVASSTESLFSVFPPVKNPILTARPRSNNYLALWENFYFPFLILFRNHLTLLWVLYIFLMTFITYGLLCSISFIFPNGFWRKRVESCALFILGSSIASQWLSHFFENNPP